MTAHEHDATEQQLIAGRFTLDELSDYLAADCQPPRPEIDADPEARHALSQLRRMHTLTNELVEQEEPEVDDSSGWWQAALTGIAAEVKAGRSVPLATKVEGAELFITEGALKALLRDAADAVPGVLIERIRFAGDLEHPEAEVAVTIDVAVRAHTVIPEAAELIRAAALESLSFNTELRIAELIVRVTDVFVPREKGHDEH